MSQEKVDQMASTAGKIVRFGPFDVTRQLFHTTPLTFALVNLRPLLPGHVLVCPHRVVPHLSDLTAPELTDLTHTVVLLQRTLKRVFNATAFNVAIQDGRAAGQSVPHVHWHIIPRKDADMDARGGGDKLYEMLEGEEGDVGAHQRGMKMGEEAERRWAKDEDRKDRSSKEMREEAEMLARELEKDRKESEGKDAAL